ncbi:hypothetical protein ACFSTE_04415 [Aquimarina hainanensis]|uniref:Outer membrane protein beta-barrel domain-containing protein n=1 Tax=Aquimarina hainanensis TaxID=1578017 RepID=A0ABW5N4N3_9FLAO
MKTKMVLLSIILLISVTSFSQEDKVYKFTFGMELEECDALGTRNRKKEVLEKNTEFVIERILANGNYVIHVLKYRKVKKDEGINARLVYKDDKSRKFFFLPKNSFEPNTEIKYDTPRHSFTFGTITVPIKLRFSSRDKEDRRENYFDFRGDVNIGLSAGYKLRIGKKKDFSLNFLAGASITSVEVDEQSTKGFVSTNTKVSAFTPSFNIVFEKKDFQIGVFSGVDFLSGELGDKWVYKHKPWLGIGLGYGILSRDKKESERTEQKERS